MRVVDVALLTCAVAHAAAPLAPRAYNPLPVGSITPKGWLLKQLQLQADGLTGHLAQFWDDVMNTVWLGGGGDGALHERTPYWLNGIVPLAFLLKNAGIEVLAPVTGIYKQPWGVKEGLGTNIAYVDSTAADRHKKKGTNIPEPVPVHPMAQVEKYVSYILSHQNANGWLGPEGSGGEQYWGPSNVLQALYQYAEGTGDPAKFKNASRAVLFHLLEQKKRMATAPLASWAQQRWMDMALTAEWLLDNADVGTHQQDLLSLIGMLHDQGADWDQWFEHFTGNAGPQAGDHNVNNAQGLKSAAVYSRYNSSATFEGHSMLELSKRRMKHMDERFGLPTGMFNGDEHLPNPPTRSPSRGIEDCGIVEAMFSYNTMFSVHGEVSFADRAERIAYNALPATWASPTGGDMWAHQYLEAVNEINAIKADPHVWQWDGDMSETYGLEPNWGCCTANFNQGWPKFASMIVYEIPQHAGIAVGLWAPASARLSDGTTVDINTTYPFGDAALVTVVASKSTPMHLRIPSWAAQATVNGKAAKNGTMWQGVATAGTSQFAVNFKPAVRLEEWDGGAVSVHRGALLYSLPISANYTVYGHHFGSDTMSNDYFLEPTSPWQFALDVDPTALSKGLSFESLGYIDGTAPFNHSNWPSRIAANLRPLPSWGTALNSAAVPPASPACASASTQSSPCGQPEQRYLVPHGGTELRIGELPLAYFPHASVQEAGMKTQGRLYSDTSEHWKQKSLITSGAIGMFSLVTLSLVGLALGMRQQRNQTNGYGALSLPGVQEHAPLTPRLEYVPMRAMAVTTPDNYST